MSTVPSLNSWTSADIDAKLKDSAKLLGEWAKLLEKAEKVSSPNDIPKTDVEQHIRLKRKLNESLGMLAKIAQSHTNRGKQSRTDNKSSASSGKASTDLQAGSKNATMHSSQSTVGMAPRPMVPGVSSQQGMTLVPQQVPGMNQAPIGAQSGMYGASLSNPTAQRMPNAPMPMYNNVNQSGQMRMAPNGAPLPNGANPNTTLSTNLLNNRAYPQQQPYPQGVGQAGMMGYHNMMQTQQQSLAGQHMHGVPYQPQQMSLVQPQPGTMNGVPLSNTQSMQPVQAPNQTMLQPPQQQQQYPPNFYAAPSSNVGFPPIHNQGSIMAQNIPQKLGAPMGGLNYPASFPPQAQSYQPQPGQMPQQQSLGYPNGAYNPAPHSTMYQMHTQAMNQSHMPSQMQPQQQQQMMLQQQQQQAAMAHHRPSTAPNPSLQTQPMNGKVPTGQQMYSMPQSSNVQLMPQNMMSQSYPNMPNQFPNQFPGQYVTQQNPPPGNHLQQMGNVPQPIMQQMQPGSVANGNPVKLTPASTTVQAGSSQQQQPPSGEASQSSSTNK